LGIYLQMGAADYGWELFLIIISSVIGLVFFVFYWEYMRRRPILYSATSTPTQGAARANYSPVMAAVMQNLQKNLQMKLCSKCGNIIPANHKFCGKCGAEAPETPASQSAIEQQLMLVAKNLGINAEGKTKEEIAKEIVEKTSKSA